MHKLLSLTPAFLSVLFGCFVLQTTDSNPAPDGQAAKSENIPAAIRSDLKGLDREIRGAYRQYIESVKDAQKKTIAALEKDLKTAMKKEDLEAAVDIKPHIKRIREMDLWLAAKPTVHSTSDDPAKLPGIKAQPSGFEISDGYWAKTDGHYGIIISGNEAKWIGIREKKSVSFHLKWNPEKGEYTFMDSKLAIRKNASGLVLVNYEKKTSHPLKQSRMPKIDF